MRQKGNYKLFWVIIGLLFLMSGIYVVMEVVDHQLTRSLMITEIMVLNGTGLTDEDGDYEDWIEIYNYGSWPINLSGWALTNDPDQPDKWMFPNVTLGSHEYLVVFASGKNRKETNAGRPLHTNFKLSADGEFIGLFNIFDDHYTDQISTQETRQFRDVAYGPSEDGSSYGYLIVASPGQANDPTFIAADTLAPTTYAEAESFESGFNTDALPGLSSAGAAGTIPLGGEVRITEIMYNPAVSNDYEFIELKNVGSEPVNLTGATMEGVQFIFPLNTPPLAPGEFLILVHDASAFAKRYPNVPVGGVYDGHLSNDGERISLLGPYGNVITSVKYDDEKGWPLSADGWGDSLELISLDGEADDPKNWRASTDLNGSPGEDELVASSTKS